MSLTTILLTLKTLWKNKSIVLLATLILTIFSFYAYHNYSSNKINQLKQTKILLENRILEQEVIINDIKNNYKKIISSRDELVKQIEMSRKEVEDLQKILNRKDRGKKTLEEMARKKTSLIESKINNATKNVLKCFELLSAGGDC